MVEGISQLSTWNTTSQKVVAGCAIIALLVLISGVALAILKSFGTNPLILLCTGGGLLGSSIIYGLILCAKGPSQTHSSTQSSINQNSQTVHKSSSQSQTITLNHLTDDEAIAVIFSVLTETDKERQEAITQLAQLGEKKSNEDKARERLYTFVDKSAMIKHLIDTLPRLKELLDSLDSGMVYDCLTDYAKKLSNESKIIQVFLLLDDAHRCALLRTHIKNKNLFLALLEKAPSTTKEELRKSDWPELLQLANDLLNAWIFKKVFYHVYAALSDEYQKSCLKRILEEPGFRSKRVEMIKETKAAVQHPIEFIEYTLGKANQKSYCGKINPCLTNDTTKLFDAILPTLPKLHIVTFFWRIAMTDLKVWGIGCGWVPEFQGKQEEKEFFKSLSFEQVTRLNKTNQPWVAMWHPSEQPDETIVDLCFNRLKRAQWGIFEYVDTEYDPTGKLFQKNWDDFLHLLSFHQVSTLICRDPHLKDLNQIFGFTREFESVSENLLTDIPNYPHTSFSKCISIPAILQRWWKMSVKEVNAQERIEAIKALKLEEKYTNYFIYMHNAYEKSRPYVEAAVKDLTNKMNEARAFVKEWSNSKKTWSEFLYEKHQARIRAEQAQQKQRQAQEKQKSLFAQNLEIIRTSLGELGLDKTKEHSKNEIEKFVRKELFKYHPDKQVNKSTEEIAKSNERYKIIANARDNLLKALTDMELERTPLC